MAVCIKICGLRSPETVAVALEAGADAIGFVFANSPRRVSVDLARRITRDLPAHVVKVAVMYHPTQTEWDEVAAGFRPDWLQTEAADFIRLTVDQSVVHMPVFRDAESLDADTVAALPQILFEASVSGVGQRANWNRAAELALTTRLMLAGGLNPGNVAAAIRQVSPWGVDVSSGVEVRRGVKDQDKIAAFIAAARITECPDAG
ncbi:MAG: phosphoribosylanthranilate isomerase [Gammaproteobacteria bacterium]|jgi:phosphoribosylanthranilate isomerase|nr:phosphoribosylanthranilate isomerase [Gammaproteobacteria bacterium]MDP7153471.1 phosphoribosylanthranilate isomerase [Gammaproteobacteria bacterium]MDP7295979.1 phosphoribosylanthranilate isomerase [Gammaproteobacteria bacterium]MDP7418461.1 phosphoribosylanthranilate isomerase [Gammaproteobacteria bacterium]MDP7660218.1 phosphoribosylanthranilate isomerase [Gammaproteobacteria bacterium]